MNDLEISALILLVLATGLTLAGLRRTRRERRALRRRQADGIRLIRLLQHLLGQFQAHRGLVSMMLNGDPSKHTPIAATQADIDRTLKLLLQHDDPSLLPPARMRRIRCIVFTPSAMTRWLCRISSA